MAAFPKGDRPAGWRKGPPYRRGKPPPILFYMNAIEIFIDESGDFGPYETHNPYYAVTMVFHEAVEALYYKIKELEYHLAVLSLANHCIHSSPAIRGEDEYFGMEITKRRKIILNLMAFIHNADFKFKCFLVKKDASMDEQSLFAALKNAIDPFITANFDKLSAYSRIEVAYDRGQKQISRLIRETLEERFDNVTVATTLPIQSRLSQVADLVCSMKRIASRLNETGQLPKTERYFFKDESNFRRNWLKPLLRSEWK